MIWDINSLDRERSGPMTDEEWLKLPAGVRERFVIRAIKQEEITRVEVGLDAFNIPYVKMYSVDPRPYGERD